MDKAAVVAALKRSSTRIQPLPGFEAEADPRDIQDAALLRTLAERIERGEESTTFGTLPEQQRVLIIAWPDKGSER